MTLIVGLKLSKDMGYREIKGPLELHACRPISERRIGGKGDRDDKVLVSGSNFNLRVTFMGYP